MKVFCYITAEQLMRLEELLSSKNQLSLTSVTFYDNPAQAAFAAYRRIGKELKLNFSNQTPPPRAPKSLRDSRGAAFDKCVYILEDQLPSENLLWSTDWKVEGAVPNRVYIKKSLNLDAFSLCILHHMVPYIPFQQQHVWKRNDSVW
jgi:hypothetical protein